jgi:hypothetical protein
MNKMAIFVEGYTEVVFVDRLIEMIANANAVRIEWRLLSGGSTCPRTSRQLKAAQPNTGQSHFVLIYDCGGDDVVKTRMISEYNNLAAAGYSQIICIRDVYPKFKYEDIPALEAALPKFVKTKPIVVHFILSIMEIESWFLAEYTHFPKIDPKITLASITENLKFDPENEDMQLRPTPADDLNKCYALAGKTYEKKNAHETVAVLDYAHIYAGLVDKFPYLRKFCEIIEEFLKGA